MSILGSIKQLWRVGAAASFEELAAADGKDGVESAVKGLPQDILRQVIVAAKLPLRVSGVLQKVPQLKSALLAFLLNLPEEQEEAGWGQM